MVSVAATLGRVIGCKPQNLHSFTD